MKREELNSWFIQGTSAGEKIIVVLFCIVFLVSNQHAFSQDRRIIPFRSRDINFDGIPDEDIWSSLESFPLVMHYPNNGRTPEQKLMSGCFLIIHISILEPQCITMIRK